MVGIDHTTLVTFRFKCQPQVHSVQVLGSWDNFGRAYPLRRDARIGREQWSGCHSYENIVCDGDPRVTGKPRRGGLKMGGTYWYYYILDGNFETFDEAQPTTTVCPLLPGQTVNILEVPLEQFEEPSRRASISAVVAISDVHTLKPTDRFQNPRPDSNPKFSRLLTSPSKLQKELIRQSAQAGSLLDDYLENSVPTISTFQSQTTAPQPPVEKLSQGFDASISAEPLQFADFDFNNFELETHKMDEESGFPEGKLYDEVPIRHVARPNSVDNCHLAYRPKTGQIRHYSLPSMKFNSAPAIFSPLGSHPVSDIPQWRQCNKKLLPNTLRSRDENQDVVHPVNNITPSTQLHLPNDAISMFPDRSETDVTAAGGLASPVEFCTFEDEYLGIHSEQERCPADVSQLSVQTTGPGPWPFALGRNMDKLGSAPSTFENDLYSPEPNSPSYVPDCSDPEQPGLDFASSPTCGSLIEDISDESFVASSASSDIWSPHGHRPLRLHSPSLDFELDRPSSSNSNTFQASFGTNQFGTFYGYSLPDEAGQSQLTITKTITPKTTPSLRPDSRDGLVPDETFKESLPSLPSLPKVGSLLDDLSYLGDAISYH